MLERKQKFFQVDAFSDVLFKGNPAGVCVLNEWLSDEIMQKIAMENNLAETAFLVKGIEGRYDLRWFTPVSEVDLCGHATLASAHILFTEYAHEQNQIEFNTRSGLLKVVKSGNDKYEMNFPADFGNTIDSFENIEAAVGVKAVKCLSGKDDYLLIVENEDEIYNATPDFRALEKVGGRGVLISSKSKDYDFISRCFFPAYGIDEDPVTGSAHTLMTPYWAKKLQKNELHAKQVSNRGGELVCKLDNDRVILIGKAITYLEGYIKY